MDAWKAKYVARLEPAICMSSAFLTNVVVADAMALSCQAPNTQDFSVAKAVTPTTPKSNIVVSKAVATFSKDGTCGSQNGGTICDPSSTVYKGGCCSQYGWCGNTVDHCLVSNGCQSGCTAAQPATSSAAPNPTAPRADGQCGKVCPLPYIPSRAHVNRFRLLAELHAILLDHTAAAALNMGESSSFSFWYHWANPSTEDRLQIYC